MSFSVVGMDSLVDMKQMLLSKSDDSRVSNQKKRAAQGAAATGITAGLVAGGIPGTKPDADQLANIRQGTSVKQRAKALVDASKGGIFGYREQAHKQAKREFTRGKRQHTDKTTKANHFWRGRNNGKIPPEKKVIQHMKGARKVSNAALLGSGALMGYTVLDKADNAKERKDNSGKWAALAGAGGVATVGTVAGAPALNRQSKKYAKMRDKQYERAQKHVPRLTADVKDNDLKDPNIRSRVFANASREQAEAAGRARGKATQYDYFRRAYRANGKWIGRLRAPAAALTAAGAAGTVASGTKDKKS